MAFEIDKNAVHGGSGIPSSHGVGGRVDSLTQQMRQAGRMTSKDSVHFSGRAGGPTQQKKGFSIFRAAKEAVKGVFRPIATILKHPLKAAALIAATVVLATVAPITIPIMVGLGLAMGGKQLLSGTGKAMSEYRKGNYEAAEKAFGDIGEGVFAVGTSMLGVRSAGAVAAEAKASAGLLKNATTTAEKLKAVDAGLDAAKTVRQGSWTGALKEVGSVFTPKGFEAVRYQLSPTRLQSLLKAKWQGFTAMFKSETVGNLDEAVKTANRHVPMKAADRPTIHNNIREVDLDGLGGTPGKQDLTGKAIGIHNPKVNALHVEANGFNHLKAQLPPGVVKHLERLPKPVQNFLGNLYMRRAGAGNLDELVAHEMAHARQASKISHLSADQARAAVRKAYPDIPEDKVDELLNLFQFRGSATSSQATRAAEKALLDRAEVYQKMQVEGQLFSRAYTRAGHEVEARRVAANLRQKQAIEQLGKEGATPAEVAGALNRYRSARIETEMNDLMSRISQLEKAGKADEAAQAEAQLHALRRLWMNGEHHMTRRMAGQEASETAQLQVLKRAEQLGQSIKQTFEQDGPMGLMQRIIARLRGITPHDLKQGARAFEQSHESLKPAFFYSGTSSLEHK